MAHSGHSRATVWSPLSGVKRTRPLSDRARDEPSPIRDAQFSVDIMQVNLHRAFSYPE
jgi:hypothetical protein